MALKVLKRQCFKVLIDHYNILTVVLISGNQKKLIFMTKKIFAANFFRSFFDHQCFFDETQTIFCVL